MTKLARSTSICRLVFWVLVLAGTSRSQTRPPVIEQLAKTYGLDSFGQIDAIRYTFNLQLPAFKRNISRTWTWEPKTGQVTYEAKDKDGKPVKVTYKRSEVSSQSDAVKKDIDPGFVNDNYWFIFPFHAYWDTSATITDGGMHKLPTGTGSATLVSVKYGPALGGYTPGDTWNLYVGKNGRVELLDFHHGGNLKPGVTIVTFVGYKKVGPLLVSTEHRGTADGNPVHLWFSDVAVKLAGADTWMEAQ